MEFKAHIEKLVGAANWSKWKRQIELLLRHHDVHVCGDRKCPSLPADASSEAVAAHSSGQRMDRLMEKFFHNDKELEDDIVSHIAKLQRNFNELNDELRRVAKTT
ncbi:retrovirus-related Pol polyprotein from transposon TNT 1-94 [Trichonephila clavipes]|nr:retrovirus-related Pol polyprotein from transposon TNT 1-94 [Trichonephila clavipes]